MITVPSAHTVASDEEIEAVAAVLRSGILANGPEAANLEREFAASCSVPHAIAVSSGTAALYVAARALGIGPGSIVAASAFSFAATANAFLSLGAEVLPIDVDVQTANMSHEALAEAIGAHPGCAAVVMVDLYGSTAGTDAAFEVAAKAGVPVIEDACQAHGALTGSGSPVGSRAALTTFSLYATKNVAAGEGGLITTADGGADDLCRMLRNHGCHTAYQHEIVGLNHRLPEMSAALGRVRLRSLVQRNRRRLENAQLLAQWCRSAWPGAIVPEPDDSGMHVFHQFSVVVGQRGMRDEAVTRLRELGVDARVHYPYTLADLPGVKPSKVPSAELLRDCILSLPVHPALSEEQLVILEEAIARVGRSFWG